MNFEFATANRIIFGPGTLKNVGPVAKTLGQHVLLVTGKGVSRSAALVEMLTEANLPLTQFQVNNEPTVDTALDGVKIARSVGCNLVIAYGGGSALDAGKTIAALLANPGDVFEYLEVVGKATPLPNPSLPCIAIPTTAGTGSEVTRNAVLSVASSGVKVSLRHPSMLPRVAIIDPELTYSLPPDLTATTGLDALTQLIEPFLSNASNPITDSLCREGIFRVGRSLVAAYRQGENLQAREDMALASLLGGMALANAKLGAVHGFAGPIGGMFPAPHGAVCARLLPIVMEANLNTLKLRFPHNPKLQLFDEVARLLTGNESAVASDGIYWLRDISQELKIPTLQKFGITQTFIPQIVDQAKKSSSMKGNPVTLSDELMVEILNKAL